MPLDRMPLAIEKAAITSQPGLSPYLVAVAARQKGDPARAVALLAPWLMQRPDDVDSRLQYGLALLDLGHLKKAEIEFRLVLQQTPAYDDARIALARIAQRTGNRAQARAALAPVPLTNPEGASLHRELAEPDPLRWGLATDASWTHLSRGQPDWREVDTQLSFMPKASVTLVGRAEASRRFNLNDTYAEGQLVYRLLPSWTAYALAGGTPHAHYRPRWQIGTGGAFRIGSAQDATVLTLDLRLSDYRSGRITTFNPGVEQFWSHGRNSLSGHLITIVEQGRARFGVLTRLDVRATARLKLFAGASHAPDVSEGTVLQTASVFGGGELSVGSFANLRLSVSKTAVRAGSDRTQLSLGFGTKF